MPDATSALLEDLAARGLTIAVAESLTGGALTAELTRPAGASRVVLGGAVVYATELKHTLAGVDAALLAERGPVDPDVALALARGIRERLAVGTRPADLGIATTGVAGPDEQDGKPVGLVYIGYATADSADVTTLLLEGDRAAIRARSVSEAVDGIRRFLSRYSSTN
ncbi:nicotinamide-nucleotide amidohydrolase family protein [Gryllotalpicola sp.]|uniref:CinA family protein n=1 Tax=Gryllotalpicola sp. TaxID=1932787 RepID=UPI0026397DD9|nr:nicotinamide-nucleotide amidohydrolase family protein [Gryllotalpicola sp.]